MSIHCESCHQEVEGMAKHLNICVKSDIPCSICPSREIRALDKEIRRHIKANGKIESAEGIFGDVSRNFGYIKRQFQTDKGMVTEFYGCLYLYKGTLFGDTLDAVATVKRVLMATIGLVLRYWFLLPFTILFYKRVFRDFIYWFAQIYEVDLKKKTYRYLAQFSPVPRELIRAGLKLANDGKDVEYNDWKENEGISDEFRVRIRRVVWCVGTFIQSDSAYYKRPQDALSNLDKRKLKENPRREILRLFDILISRENTIKHKVNQLRKLASILLYFPPIKRLVFEYFNEFDVSQFQPDEADRYFAARVQGYDFEGKTIEERRAWAEKMDKEKGNVLITT